MTGYDAPFDPAVEPLLEHGRVIPRVPDMARARSLTRARATIAAAALAPPEAVILRPRRLLPIVLAASIALTVGAAGAVAALYARAPQAPQPAVGPRAATAPVRSLALAPAPPSVFAVPTPPAKPIRVQRSPAPRESYAVELELLSRAQAAYARRDFAGALALVAEHGRRFPNGRLAEEREALRVRSLAKSGRSEDAAHAAAAFAEHFPRSVLLPRLRRELSRQAPARTGAPVTPRSQ